MIEFTRSYKTTDGQVFGTIEEAQQHDLIFLGLDDLAKDSKNIAAWIVKNKDAVIDILTITPNSKPRARSLHGGTKKRKKTIITDADISVLSNNTATMKFEETH